MKTNSLSGSGLKSTQNFVHLEICTSDKDTITDGGSTATHLKAKSGLDQTSKLLLLEHLAVLIIFDEKHLLKSPDFSDPPDSPDLPEIHCVNLMIQ